MTLKYKHNPKQICEHYLPPGWQNITKIAQIIV